MEMIAARVRTTRRATWQESTEDGRPLNRTLGIAASAGRPSTTRENSGDHSARRT